MHAKYAIARRHRGLRHRASAPRAAGVPRLGFSSGFDRSAEAPSGAFPKRSHASTPPIEYPATLPASEIKIDRSFITDILDDGRAEAIVRSTIDLARNLELSVVAEGIETEAVMAHLADLGCATGQGYVISRPLPAEELTPQLAGAFGIPAAELGAGSPLDLARSAS